MKNRIWVFVVAFVAIVICSTEKMTAQNITSHANSNTWLNLNSFYGVENSNEFSLYIQTLENLGSDGADVWSVYVKLDETKPIKGTGKKQLGILPNQIKVRFNQFVGGDPSRITTNRNYVSLLSGVFMPVIDPGLLKLKNTNAPSGNQFFLQFDIKIEEGCHLADFAGKHNLGLVFEVRYNYKGVAKTTISKASTQLTINIPYGQKCPFPDIPDPEEPVFSYAIEIKGDAPNGLLEFNDINDYVNGVSKRYENGLLITSSTSYAVTVQSLTDNFIAIDASNNNTLPLNTVSLEVQNSTNNNILGTVPLSNGSQTIFNMQKEFDDNPQPHPFNIRYFTEANDERLIKVKPDNYKTTLQYTLVPQ